MQNKRPPRINKEWPSIIFDSSSNITTVPRSEVVKIFKNIQTKSIFKKR